MAINPRKIKKKVTPRPAKDLRSTDPKDLRNKALREANRAANENKPRYDKKIGPDRPQGPEEPRYKQKIGPSDKPAYDKKIGPKKPSVGSQLTKGALKKVPVIGTAIGFIADASPAGPDSTVPGAVEKAREKRFKREIRQGTKLAVTGVQTGTYKNYGEKIGPKKSSGFGKRVPEGAKFERLRASRAALGGAKTSASSSGGTPFPKGKGTASLPKVKSSTSSTAATAAAASSSTTGKTTGKSTTVVKERVGLQSRYQRDALAMETRNKSGNKAKKSILSLFRKG